MSIPGFFRLQARSLSATADPTKPSKHDFRIRLGVCVGLAFITWIAFGQTLNHEFINRDDPDYVLDPHISKGLTVDSIAWAFSHKVSSNWHPLTMITHMLDCQVYGLRPGGHHATNVALHTLAAILLFLVLGRMTGAIWCSGFVAALFAIHPQRVESVAWIAERKDVLSGVFFMLTLAAYLRYVRRASPASYLPVLFLFALGLMSKPMLVTLPFVLLLLDYWPLRRFAAEPSLPRQSVARKLIWEKIPLLLLSAIACGIALVVQQEAMVGNEVIPLWVRLYNALISSVAYIWQMFWPVKLALLYPLPFGVLSGRKLFVAIAVLFAVTYTAWVLRKRRPYIVTGWLWYLGMLVPVIGLVQVGAQARADHYTYLPQIGLYLAATWAVADLSISWRYRRQILSALAAVVIVMLTWRTWIQASYWKNSKSIWTRTLAVTSNNAVAHRSLGYFLLEDGQLDDAIFHLEEADRIWPQKARVHEKLAAALEKKGRTGEAFSHYQKALQLRPEDADDHDSLGSLLWREGKTDEAIEQWQKALSTHPEDPSVHTNLGTALMRKQLVSEAIAHYEKSLAVAPESVVTLNNLALVFATCSDARFRNGSRAMELAKRADQLSGGKNAAIVRTLSAAYAESGRFNDAIDAAKRAFELATAQGDGPLASSLQMDLDLYRMNFPRRTSAP